MHSLFWLWNTWFLQLWFTSWQANGDHGESSEKNEVAFWVPSGHGWMWVAIVAILHAVLLRGQSVPCVAATARRTALARQLILAVVPFLCCAKKIQIWQSVSQNSEALCIPEFPPLLHHLWNSDPRRSWPSTAGLSAVAGVPPKMFSLETARWTQLPGVVVRFRFHHFRVLFFPGWLSWRVLLEWLGVQPVKLAWRLDRYWTGVGYKNGEFNKELPKLLQCTENAALEQKSGLDFAEVMWREKNYHRDLYNFHYISLIKIWVNYRNSWWNKFRWDSDLFEALTVSYCFQE